MRGQPLDPLYGRVAAELIDRIAGRAGGVAGPVHVICWSEKDWRRLVVSFQDAGKVDALEYWLGWATKGRGMINLSYLACLQLDRIAYRDGRLALPATGSAVGTLAHETMHVAGISDEGIADCYAMQLTTVTALGLDAERDYAELLQKMNFEFNRERRAGTEYDSPDCYDGGPLDLAPESLGGPDLVTATARLPRRGRRAARGSPRSTSRGRSSRRGNRARSGGRSGSSPRRRPRR